MGQQPQELSRHGKAGQCHFRVNGRHESTHTELYQAKNDSPLWEVLAAERNANIHKPTAISRLMFGYVSKPIVVASMLLYRNSMLKCSEGV